MRTIALLFSATMLFAQTSTQPATPPLTAVTTFLGLSDTLVTQLVQLRQQERTALRPILQQMRTQQQALRTALQANDSTAASAAMAAIKSLQDQVKSTNASYRSQALALLTPDQQTKLQTLQKAAQLLPAIRQAGALNLLDAPGGGPGGPGLRGPQGMMMNRFGGRPGAGMMRGGPRN
jgi:Spy/CpxP family protein refolding chaperone